LTAPSRATLEDLVAAKEIVVVCGPGGVGKTTVAASIGAMAACQQGGRVLVLTVDPARRLAQALGLGGRDGEQGTALAPPRSGSARLRGPRALQVPPSAFEQVGASPRGELWAEMLDTKLGWDNLVSLHAPDPATAKRILENSLYQNISGRFVQSHDYIAVERLYELHSEGAYDLIVVDTPPTRNAVDFLLAPERMADFFASRLLRILTVPYRSRFVDLASRPFYYVADRVLGTQFLEDIAEFFILFQTLSEGFVERAKHVERLLADRRTTFIVVSTLEPVPVREAEAFIRLLPARRLHLGGVVLNRALPSYLTEAAVGQQADWLQSRSAQVAQRLCAPGGPLEACEEALVDRVLGEIAANFSNIAVVAKREAAQRAELSWAHELVSSIPELDEDVHDLAGVLALGRHLWSARAA